jgi:hypothetical protein
VTVTKKEGGGGSYFKKPDDWKTWSDGDGTRILLCPECDAAMRDEFLKLAKRKQKAGQGRTA